MQFFNSVYVLHIKMVFLVKLVVTGIVPAVDNAFKSCFYNIFWEYIVTLLENWNLANCFL